MAQEEVDQLAMDGGGTLTSLWTAPASALPADWVFVYAPGASSNVHDPFGRFAAQQLARAGIGTLRFQFPYMEAKRRLPDRPALLEATWRAAIEAARGYGRRLAIGGRSMGGRIASQVVSQGARIQALVLFAYPLHPPGRPTQRRDEHLARIAVPTLFCSGTRDAFASPEELRSAAALVPAARLHLLQDADHAFAVPRSSGRTRQDLWREAADVLVGWLSELAAS